MSAEWEEFTVGKQPAGAASDDWEPLTSVRHGTHLTPAVRIAEDRGISAELINDGRLANTRTKAIYLSPNYWHEGSRYGSFEFEVDWAQLSDGRDLYWVEPIKTYGIPIHRFMLTRRPSPAGLTPYDPAKDDGPLRLIAGEWFRTSGHACEILVDEDLPLSEITRFRVVTHHEKYCSLGQSHCEEAGILKSRRASGRFQGAMLGQGLKSLNILLVENGKPTFDAQIGLSNLSQTLTGKWTSGGMVNDDTSAREVLKGAMLLLSAGDRDGARQLAQLIDTKDRLDRVLLEMIRAHFNTPAWDWDDV